MYVDMILVYDLYMIFVMMPRKIEGFFMQSDVIIIFIYLEMSNARLKPIGSQFS